MSSLESGKRTPDRHTSCANSKAPIARVAALPASAHRRNLRRCGVGLLVFLLVALTGALPLALGGCDDNPGPVTLGPTLSLTSSTTGSTTTSTTALANGSSKSPKVSVPDLFGLDLDVAEATLTPLGLTCEVVHQEWQSAGSSDENVVYEQDIAAGTMVTVGSSVGVSVWRWGAVMPYVVGMTQAEAIAELGFHLLVANVVHTPVLQPGKIGIVLSQDPAAGIGVPFCDGPVTITVGEMAVKPTFPSVSTIPSIPIPPLVPIVPNP